MLKRVFFPFLIYLYSANACSAAWEMKSEYRPVNATYGYFVAKIVAWDTEDKTPNPLYGCSSGGNLCYLAFTVDNYYFLDKISFQNITTSKTLGELGKNFIQSGLLNREYRSMNHYYPSQPSCIYFGYNAQGSNGSWSVIWFPGGEQCREPEIVPNVCELREPLVELDHGMLRAEVINGNTAEATLTVACTFNFKVRVMTSDRSGTVYFNDKKQFRSELKLDGVNAGNGVLVTAPPEGKTLTLTSTLAGYDGSVGEFQGSKSLIISLP
ncbi:PapG chaperone-binding domain-containing protein [Serratia ureilytica]|uniref:MrpH family fimbial adhesin n=1 Tax=Serratia ureilytica TaxID=300181 RepID=UPI00313AEB3E